MKTFEQIVEACLANKDFQAQEEPEVRKATAEAFAKTILEHDESEPEFTLLSSSDDIVLEAANDGELIRFKNAILAREETNKNGDTISAENIAELAASIVGRAADIDHVRVKNAGIITEARVGQDKGKAALFIGGLLWRDRYTKEVDGVRAGTHQLSVEAVADFAVCSTCQGEYETTTKYCNHLKARKATGAKRSFKGLKGKGMGITPKPAGDAYFDREQIFVVANHQEETSMDCPHCGKEATGEKCPACNKSTVPSVIASELKTATDSLNALQASTEAAKVEAEAKVKEYQTKLEAAELKVKEADDKALKVRTEAREKVLASLLTPEKLTERKEALLGLEDTAFNAVTASLSEAAQSRNKNGAAIRLGAPEQSVQNTGKKLVLR